MTTDKGIKCVCQSNANAIIISYERVCFITELEMCPKDTDALS